MTCTCADVQRTAEGNRPPSRVALAETGVDPDLCRDDGARVASRCLNQNVIPAQAGTHASFSERLGAVLAFGGRAPFTPSGRDDF